MKAATTVDLKAALEERYLAYALSTIMHRALPDVRDGLKPVHRPHYPRHERNGYPAKFSVQEMRIVGDVIGKFHPHGDQSVYDALVRLAQDFSQRYPVVDGQGNFGNIDGDSAAAYRYTEARMTDVAALLLEGIDRDAVDFRPTYNEEDEERYSAAPFQTCWPMAHPVSLSAWQPRSRRTMLMSCAMQRFT